MQRAHVLAAVLALVAGAPCSLSLALSSPAQTTQQAQGVDLSQYTSGAISRLALLDLRTIEDPKASDYSIALSLLEVSQTLAPNDVDVARRRAEAAWLAGDEPGLMAATEQVVKLDPRDTVATLRLITTRIGKLQTVEERLAKYDAFIAYKGPNGESLDASLRSRLALDAALLLKERGDEAGFLDRLKQSCQFDSTNKDAALMAFNYFAERSPDAMGRIELVSNLLMSDPLDVKAHERLRDEFASVGAWKAAKRFHGIVGMIYAIMGVRDTTPLQVGTTILHWKTDGVRATLDSINTALAEKRASVGRNSNLQGAAFLDRPEDVRVELPFEEVRLAAAIASQRPNDVAASATDLAKTLQVQVEYLRDRGRRPAEMTDDEAQQSIRDALMRQSLWLCLVESMNIKPPADVPQAPAPGGPTAPPPAPSVAPAGAESALVDAWIAIAKKDYPRASELLDQAGDSLWTDLGRAVVLNHTVADGEAARAFLRVSERAPITPLGAMCSEIAERLSSKDGGARPLVNTDAEKFEDFARTIPAWVDVMATKPYSFQSMRVEPVTSQTGAIEPAYVRVKIKNLSQVPLGLGAGRTINSRLLFVPSLSSNNSAAVQGYEPEVFELDRRLRLMPQEELEAIIWPEIGIVGYALEQGSYFPSRVRWRVIQGFESAGQGKRRPGLGCVESQLDAGILHESLPEARASSEELLRRIQSTDEASLPALFVGARLKLLIGRDPANDRLADAIVRRFPTLSPTARMLALATLPASQHIPALRGIEEALARETDPRVLLIAVITRTASPDDAIMAIAGASNDPVLVKAVAAMKDRFARHLQREDPSADAPVPGQGVDAQDPTRPAQGNPASPK